MEFDVGGGCYGDGWFGLWLVFFFLVLLDRRRIRYIEYLFKVVCFGFWCRGNFFFYIWNNEFGFWGVFWSGFLFLCWYCFYGNYLGGGRVLDLFGIDRGDLLAEFDLLDLVCEGRVGFDGVDRSGGGVVFVLLCNFGEI